MPLRYFISYNHKDKADAERLKTALRAAGHEVVIDSEAMAPGEDIKGFIEKCIRQSDVTLSLVSRHSLLSAWVAMESIGTFFAEKNADKGRFVAAYIDGSFFDRKFTDEALDEVENQISEIKTIIKDRLDKDRGIADLENELKRRRDLRNNLDEIVRRLRESLCVDLTGDKFQSGLELILKHAAPAATPATTPTPVATVLGGNATPPSPMAGSNPPSPPANPPISQAAHQSTNQPPKFIILYDIADDAVCKTLNKYLNILKMTKKIQVYNIHEGLGGSDVVSDAQRELAAADYILTLMTDNFVGSEWMGMAWEAAEAKRRVVPIRIGKIDYGGTGLEKLRALPTQNRTLADFATPDAAYADIVAEIKRLAQG